MKYDNNKYPLSLVPPQVINEVADVLGFGASKYGPNNWRKDGGNTEWSRTYSSIQRHLNAFWGGEDLDPVSGKKHLSHAATQLFILIQHINDGHTQMDDRFKG